MQLHNDHTETLHCAPFDNRFAGFIPAETLDHARRIGVLIQPALVNRPSYVLGVTSALVAEGKTTVSAALADVMAADFGHTVVLLDAHAERPWSFGGGDTVARRGLSDWLDDECPLAEAVITTHDRPAIVPLGSRKFSSRALLQGMVKRNALDTLRERYSLVIADLPELTNPTAPALANLCDGILLVARAGQTPVETLKQFLPMLQNVAVHGVVLNRQKSALPRRLQHLLS